MQSRIAGPRHLGGCFACDSSWGTPAHAGAAGTLLPPCRSNSFPPPSPTGPLSQHPALLQAPLLFLVAFGSYLLVLLIAGALSFRTCPEDAKALQQVGWELSNTPVGCNALLCT